jgi:hypothetical protein
MRQMTRNEGCAVPNKAAMRRYLLVHVWKQRLQCSDRRGVQPPLAVAKRCLNCGGPATPRWAVETASLGTGMVWAVCAACVLLEQALAVRVWTLCDDRHCSSEHKRGAAAPALSQ